MVRESSRLHIAHAQVDLIKVVLVLVGPGFALTSFWFPLMLCVGDPVRQGQGDY